MTVRKFPFLETPKEEILTEQVEEVTEVYPTL